MCDRDVSEDAFMLIYCTNRYKTQRMCNKAANDCLAALKFVPDCLLQVKCSKILMMLYS